MPGVCIPTASRSRADTEQVELVAEALPPVPRSIHDVDNGKILGFGEELGAEHPGYHDEAYKRRRMNIVQLARSHCVGEPIPRVQYTSSEVEAWAHAVRELKALYPTHACKEFLHNWELFDFRDDVVPQLEDVSAVLKARTGWQIRPVAGLLHPRDFLNGLAFRTFHSTQYMRHHSQPMYTPEPDVIHELLGTQGCVQALRRRQLCRKLRPPTRVCPSWITLRGVDRLREGVCREGRVIRACGDADGPCVLRPRARYRAGEPWGLREGDLAPHQGVLVHSGVWGG
jgi:hypothetical protein